MTDEELESRIRHIEDVVQTVLSSTDDVTPECERLVLACDRLILECEDNEMTAALHILAADCNTVRHEGLSQGERLLRQHLQQLQNALAKCT